MPDLLTHVLIGYTLATALRLHYPWLTQQYVTVVMVGTVLPDVSKTFLFIPNGQIRALLGVPFSWQVLHTNGGVVLAIALGALIVPAGLRRRVFLLLGLGGVSHQISDMLLLTASGYWEKAFLWPLSQTRFPTPGLYLSTDLWPVIMMSIVASGTALVVRKTAAASTSPNGAE